MKPSKKSNEIYAAFLAAGGQDNCRIRSRLAAEHHLSRGRISQIIIRAASAEKGERMPKEPRYQAHIPGAMVKREMFDSFYGECARLDITPAQALRAAISLWLVDAPAPKLEPEPEQKEG